MEEASTGSGPFFSQLINLGLPWKSVYGQLPPPGTYFLSTKPKTWSCDISPTLSIKYMKPKSKITEKYIKTLYFSFSCLTQPTWLSSKILLSNLYFQPFSESGTKDQRFHSQIYLKSIYAYKALHCTIQITKALLCFNRTASKAAKLQTVNNFQQ